ncbi:MAG: FadR family transcriptional regulator [Bacteroidetes bacterium]|nr:FadR family transcriptional regulator [Bacteroidota bacterium]MBU1117038.1 FadR family transcriptional regulator [Bacteroidota bacterium]MBU1797633.1 FadR family transcriptional regulator [Bacteroidota bacterium]
MFKSVEERIPIKEIIVKQVEEAILSRKFLPGDKLPTESELGTQFGVSRTSVREAIQILSARGLISVEKGRGIFVNKITSKSVVDPLKKFLQLKLDKDSVLNLTHARQIIEPAIVREAAKNRTMEDIEILTNDIKDLESCVGDYEELAALDMRFHLNIAKATHNIIIPLIIQPIHSLLPKIKPIIFATVEDSKVVAIIWHKKILDAIINQDEETAFNEMVEHLKLAELHSKKVLEIAKTLNK